MVNVDTRRCDCQRRSIDQRRCSVRCSALQRSKDTGEQPAQPQRPAPSTATDQRTTRWPRSSRRSTASCRCGSVSRCWPACCSGRLVPGLGDGLSAVEVDGVSLPIALGLLVMMYPVLAKVRYDRLDSVTGDKRLLVSSLFLNWVLGPALMFALAWIFLPDLPAYRTGLIIVGLARCIAMVIIWNDLACGDREAAAVLVALNSVFQVVAFAGLGWFYLSVLPGWLGLEQTGIDASTWDIARSVLIFLGIPLVAGFLSRRIGEGRRGRDVVRDEVHPAGRAVGALRPALHHRHPLRPAGRRDHLAARSTSCASRCPCSSTSP